jgi:hypothetical protein
LNYRRCASQDNGPFVGSDRYDDFQQAQVCGAPVLKYEKPGTPSSAA